MKQNILDTLRKIKRGPQVILPRDASIIVAETGCSKDWKVVDAGTGSAFLALFLANLGCKVYSYEKDNNFYKLAKENVKKTGFKNIILKNKDITKGISERGIDLVTLDMKDSYKVIKNVYNSLNLGGWIAVYVMHVEQMQKVWRELEKLGFKDMKIIESIRREWQIEGKTYTRPKSQMIGHTGFLIFGRK